MLHNPALEPWFFACPVARNQLEAFRELFPALNIPSGMRFSRSAALSFAKDFREVVDTQAATTLACSDLRGGLSFLRLADYMDNLLDSGPYTPSDVPLQDVPFRVLCDWLLSTEQKVGRAWTHDEAPVIPIEDRIPPEE